MEGTEAEASELRHLLADVGVTSRQEKAYRLLLERGSLSICELSGELVLTTRATERLLRSLEFKTLVMRCGEPMDHYVAVSPEIAVEALILRKQAHLERVRHSISLLRGKNTSGLFTAEGPIAEILTPEEVARTCRQVLRTTQHEVRHLVKNPFPEPLCGRLEEQMRACSVQYLNVMQSEDPAMPQVVECIRRGPVGAQARIFPRLPFGLVIADRRIALLPLDTERLDGPSLLVHRSALLDGLNALFEMIWSRGIPIGSGHDNGLGTQEWVGGIPEEMQALIPLLAAGFNDKAIAHELGISLRTMLRRMTVMLSELGARSRFQAGWMAAMRHQQSDSKGGTAAPCRGK